MMIPNQNNPSLIPNYFNISNQPILQTLGLNQMEGFNPVESFVDRENTVWKLAKAASNSTVGIPDPKSIRFTEFWNHGFPRKDLQGKLFVYIVEGIKLPQVATEQPMRVLFQWFSTVNVNQFTPEMITPQEWQRANVYAAPIVDKWMSILSAVCKVNNEEPVVKKEENTLINMENLINGTN